MSRHQNLHGECPACESLFDTYPNFNADLRLWFNALRCSAFDAHISCAGRGQVAQEAAVARYASKAHYGESAHNYNAAIDLWQLTSDGKYSLDPDWFDQIMKDLPTTFAWYGSPEAAFYERPHVELASWRVLKHNGQLTLVE